MIRPSLILGWLSVGVILAEDAPPVRVMPVPDAKETTAKSSTRQFKVSGGTSNEQGMVINLAEEAKTELLRLTDERDDWKVPVRILLHGKKGDPAPARTMVLSIFLTDEGYEVVADVHLSQGVVKDRFRSHITSALIYERALRMRGNAESEMPLHVSPWLVVGLQEATAWRLNLSDRRLYEALFKMGGFFKIDELFAVNTAAADEMDAATGAAFRVSSGALVMALLQQPHGKDAFRSFLTDVASYEGEMPSLLRKHFPELNLSETSLAKWWALQMASIGGKNLLTDVLSIAETETALARALKFTLKTPEGGSVEKDLSAWQEIAQLPPVERAVAVKSAQEALVRLSLRCFPSFRPILFEYQTALGEIVKGKIEKTAQHFSTLQDQRTNMSTKAARAKDYLIWFEMTRAQEISGDFDSFIRLKETLKAPVYRKTDSMTLYLDEMDKLFDRGQTPQPQQAPIEFLPELPR